MNLKSPREIELEEELRQLKYENARLRYLIPTSPLLPSRFDYHKPLTLTVKDPFVPVYKIAATSLHLRDDLKAREIYLRANGKNGAFGYQYMVDNSSLLNKKDLAYALAELHERTLRDLYKSLQNEEDKI